MRVARHDQSDPSVGGLGRDQAGGVQTQVDLGEAVEVLLVEAAQIRLPEQVDIRDRAGGGGVPQPHRLGRPVMRQLLHLDPDQGSRQDRQVPVRGKPGPLPAAVKGLMQAVPGTHLDPAIPLAVLQDPHIGHRMGGRVAAGEACPVPGRTPTPRPARTGRGAKHPVRAHPPQQLHRPARQRMGRHRGRVSGIEHHQGRRIPHPPPPGRDQVPQQRVDLLDQDLRVTVARQDPTRVHRVHPGGGTPGQSDQDADRPPRDEPVPARTAHLHHRQTVHVPGVRPRNRADIDPEHQRLTRPGRRNHPSQHSAQPCTLDPPGRQRVVHHAVPPAKLRLQRELHRREHGSRRAQQRVRQLEQRIRPAPKTPIQITPEPNQPIKPCRALPDTDLDHAITAWHHKTHGHPTFFESYDSPEECQVAVPRVRRTHNPNRT